MWHCGASSIVGLQRIDGHRSFAQCTWTASLTHLYCEHNMATVSLVRLPMGDPVPKTPTQHSNINFRHPGYQDGRIQLTPHTFSTRRRRHPPTTLIACAILANNRWDGWLAEERGGERLDSPEDGILRRQNYYFCASTDAHGMYRSLDKTQP